MASATAPQQFVCVAKSSVGFRFQKGKWLPGQFELSTYVIRPAQGTEVDRGRWTVVRHGQSYPLAICADLDSKGWLSGCKSVHEVSFNAKTLRFLVAYLPGYVVTEKGRENDNTPYMAIGECSKL
jgi:hypothetical protein